MEKIIKILRALSIILRASLATRCSFQLSPQQTSDLIHNWQLQMQNGVFQALPLLTVSSIHRLYVDKCLLIEVVTVAFDGRLGAIY